ncbi:PLP-dependent aminotransferase family protein [Streptomyces achromogenes]|uniref:aminotransferase-like domain-containing protein n=1 Tax=Streptomyces achromogenes TaxID=67255 RepID=UPI0034479010
MDQTSVFDFVLRKNADLVSFALGLPNPDLFPVAELTAAVDAVFKSPGDVYQYANPLEELREHIVRLMAMRGVTCAPEQIVLTHGAQHGIDMAVRLLCGSGRPIVLEEITYTGALSAVLAGDTPVHTVGTSGSLARSVAGLVGAGVRPGAMYVMPEGHNPLGVSLPGPERRALAELAREHAFTLIEDDAYGFLQYDDEPRPALRSLEDRWVFYVGSFSKIISPGLRVGWIVVPDALVDQALVVKEASTLEVATPGQHIVARLLDGWDLAAHIGVLRREYALRRDVMRRCLEEVLPAKTPFSRPDSGMFFWVELPEGVDTGELLKVAASEYGVSFVPGDLYLSGPVQAKRNYLRLSFSCVSPAEIEAGTERLGRLLRDRGIA